MEPRGKLLVGALLPASDPRWVAWAREELTRLWGAPQREAGPFSFPWTAYYAAIAPDLDRWFWSFPGLWPQGELPDWKRLAGELERASGVPRRVNLDPGYLEGAKLLLASRKNHAHRIYLRDGVYGEVTLVFREGRFVPFPYTFPDFRSGLYDPFLTALRRDWKEARRAERTLSEREENGEEAPA